MIHPVYEKLADLLVCYSVALKQGDRVLIDSYEIPDDFVIALLRASRKRGAVPYVNLNHTRVSREICREASEDQLSLSARLELQRMKHMDAYIALRGSDNIFEHADVPAAKMKLVTGKMRPVLDWRVKKTRWVVLRWPTPAMAQQARMSTEAFERFFFEVCTLDYSRMAPGMKALCRLMGRTERVHIKGGGSDLRFSIKGIGSVACGGHRNIPDGEVFTSPVRNSVVGVLACNVSTVYQGTLFENVHLEFDQGRIVNATANNSEKLNQILNSDPGARYIGEFSLAFNPHIQEPMQDILFDEKIAGSFHFTPGQAYEEADNGNRSRVHWDMVCIQRPEYGGGEIYFDDKLIRKDGHFVPKLLQKLNPEYLLMSG